MSSGYVLKSATLSTKSSSIEIFIVFVVDSGELYTWGRGSFGRLGLGSNEDQWIPKKVSGVEAVFSGFLKLCTSIIFIIDFIKSGS